MATLDVRPQPRARRATTFRQYHVRADTLAEGQRACLDAVLSDGQIEEVIHHGPGCALFVYHRRFGLCETNMFLDDDVSLAFITEVAQAAGSPVGPEHPLVEASMDGMGRLSAVLPPVGGHHPTFAVRRSTGVLLTLSDLVRMKTLGPEAAAWLWTAVEGVGGRPANLVVVGGTSTGKTTFLNGLLVFVPNDQRVVAIEDVQELRIPQRNRIQLGTTEGVGMERLLIHALRQRPDRIIVGEVRGSEAQTLFGAMNTGHSGCMGRLHANDARQCVRRVTHSPMNVPMEQLRGLDLIITLGRRGSGGLVQRHVVGIHEVTGVHGKEATLNPVFEWDGFAGKLRRAETPTRLRRRICEDVGITVGEFRDVVKRRTAIVRVLSARTGGFDDMVEAVKKENNRFDRFSYVP